MACPTLQCDAARTLAGWHVLRLLPEPTAAAFSYGLLQGLDPSQDHYIMVADLGGGTYDCTLMHVKRKQFKVLGTGGDNHFGGRDFDRCLAKVITHKFAQTDGEIPTTLARLGILSSQPCKTAPHALQTPDVLKEVPSMTWSCQQPRSQIEREAEKAKRLLSSKHAADVHVKHDGTILQTTVTREEFEEGCSELFDRIPEVPMQILADKGLQPSDVNILLAVGGSSYMPRVRELHRNAFPEGRMPLPDGDFDPELAVVHGASLCAEYLVKDPSLLPMDVIPLSLGLPEMQPVEQLTVEVVAETGIKLTAFPEFAVLSELAAQSQVGVQVHPPALSRAQSAVQPTYIFLVIDVSGSMSDPDESGRRKLDSVKDASQKIVASAPDSMSLSICTFGSHACVAALPLTRLDDHGKQTAISFVQKLVVSGSTNMAAGIDKSMSEIAQWVQRNALRQATMVILTDGYPQNQARASQSLERGVASLRMQDVSFAVSTFGFGDASSRGSLNGDLLQAMAAVGGGHYYYVRSGDNVDTVFSEIIADAQQAIFAECQCFH